MKLNENERAARAGRLWEPGQGDYCPCGHYIRKHTPHRLAGELVAWPCSIRSCKCAWFEGPEAPDMHLPENWARALENRKLDIGHRVHGWFCDSGPDSVGITYADHQTAADAVFATLVALDKAEHPQQE